MFNKLHKKMQFHLIEPLTFWGSICLLLSVTIPLVIWPEQGAEWVKIAKNFMSNDLGIFYLLLGISAIFFMLYIVFSDIGHIKLGEANEKPEFATFSWAAMLFCGGIGASILYWSLIEWAYYYQSPPFLLEPASPEAVQWASTYGLFHWGFIAWAIYAIPAIPIAYFYYVRKIPVLKISTALMPVLGEQRSKSWIGKLIDVSFIFGMLGGGATTLGLAAPLINEGLKELFNVPTNTYSQIVVLLICTMIFAYSAYSGLKKGIQVLSNINMFMALILLAFVLIFGPTIFIIETGLDAFGRMMNNFFTMSSWTEPFRGINENFPATHFAQNWTIFYWAWWLVFAPSMGLFISKISRGRTIRQMVIGSLCFGSFGCFAFFIILGNYGLHLQLTNALDVVSILNEHGAPTAIFAILNTLPTAKMVVLMFTVLAIIFTATTFDSISYILSAVVQKNVDAEPMRWNRLFWAFALSLLPIVLLFLGGLNTLQTASIVGGVPLLIISIMLMISTVKAAQFDLQQQDDYIEPTINIENFDHVLDPWSEEGKAFKVFEDAKNKAMHAAQHERNIRDEIVDLKAKIRAEFLQSSSDNHESFHERYKDQILILEEELKAQAEIKAQATDAVSEARVNFRNIMKAKEEAEAAEAEERAKAEAEAEEMETEEKAKTEMEATTEEKASEDTEEKTINKK